MSASEQAEHFWPEKPKADTTMPSAAASRSASAATMMASLPPISAVMRFSQRWPGCTLAPRSKMRMPTSFEPVNATKRVWGWSTRRSPISPPLPGRKLTTPAGTPASSMSSNSL
jgi:hypothetical protein